jgi:soluble lytic murein transglycosylase
MRQQDGRGRKGGLAAALGCLWLFGAGASAAAGQLYGFVDGRGVLHFSNIPNDPRYTRITLERPAGEKARGAPDDFRYDGLIRLTALEHDLPPALVKAVIAAESNFEAGAISHKGAQGLMQLMPETARVLGVDDPFRPTENVRGGTRLLRELVDRYGDLNRALAAYNAGTEAVDRHGGVPPYRETRDYVTRVMNYYRVYHGDFGR